MCASAGGILAMKCELGRGQLDLTALFLNCVFIVWWGINY